MAASASNTARKLRGRRLIASWPGRRLGARLIPPSSKVSGDVVTPGRLVGQPPADLRRSDRTRRREDDVDRHAAAGPGGGGDGGAVGGGNRPHDRQSEAVAVASMSPARVEALERLGKPGNCAARD